MSHCQTGAFASAKPRPSRKWWLLAGIWSLLCVISPVTAADRGAKIESVQVGFRGVVEVGRWSPITVSVSGNPGTQIILRVTTADAEGRPLRQPGSPVVLGESSTALSMVYQHGPIDSPVVVELLQGEAVLDELTLHAGGDKPQLQTVTQLTDFVVCLGHPLLGFERAAQQASDIRQARPDRVSPLLVQDYSLEQLQDLPSDARGWEAVDVCVITSECLIPEALGRLIQEWVRQGGRLVLVGGEQVTSASSPGLSSWLPVQQNGAVTLRDITSLNTSIPGSATLRLREGSLRAVQWAAESGAVLSPSLDGPLVVRVGESQGTVTAIALDINAPPFVSTTGERSSIAWESLPDLCRWLSGLNPIPKLEEGSQRPQSDLNPTGVSDLQTQLINTLDQFPEVTRPSYWVVLGTTLLFVLIVGPLDYLLVHRLLKRPHWTWLTLPLWIALGGVVGLSAASRTGGTRELTRQLDLETWDAQRGEAQLDSWLTIYSPGHHRYEVACEPGLMHPGVEADTHLRWAGRPEAGFRGLYRSTGINGGATVEQAADGRAIQSLPIRHGASAVLEAKSKWDGTPPLTNELFDPGDGHLKGTFSHQFEGELVDWVLAYGSFAYLPSRSDEGIEAPLTAGQTIRADQVPSRLLADYLVRLSTRSILRRDRKSADYSMGRAIYDPLSRDLYNLLRTASFHEAVDGTAYTGLSNSTLQNEDLTPLISAHRAVFFGRWRNAAYHDSEEAVESVGGAVEPLAAQFKLDGQPISPRYRECFVRWILPVKQSSGVTSAP